MYNFQTFQFSSIVFTVLFLQFYHFTFFAASKEVFILVMSWIVKNDANFTLKVLMV